MNEPGSLPARTSLSCLLDEARLSAYQIAIIAMCAAIAMLDGFDTQAIGFTAPALAASLNLPVNSFGPIFAGALAGGLLGALLFGRLADRVGRKRTILITTIVFAAGSLLTLTSDSRASLFVFRLLTGVGLGGAMPSIIAMTAEYSPRRYRATLVTAMFCGFPLGAVIGALASTPLLEHYGWRAVFLSGGLLPLLLVPVVSFFMPESIRWLAANGHTARIDTILARMGPAAACNSVTDRAQAQVVVAARISALFAGRLAMRTALLWCTFFFSLLLVYLLVSWIPTLAQQTGRAGPVSTFSAALLNLGGMIGSICFSRIADRTGPFTVVSPAYAIGAAVVCGVGLATDLAASIYWFAALVGFFCIGAQLCVVAIASEMYPLELRATGVGWAMGIGRLGAISGPLVGGLLMHNDGGHRLLFILLAATSLGCALAVIAMREKAPNYPLC